MSEFNAYGKYKTDVERLVNDDIGADIFFNSLNNESDVVTYIDKIENIFNDLNKWKGYDCKIFPTTIQINNKYDNIQSTHSVVLILKDGNFYFYDPNGVYNTEEEINYENYGLLQQNFGYGYNGTYFGSTIKFKKFIEKNYKINLSVSTTLGAQFLLPIEEDTIYIKEGGYCMFFNYMVIEYVLNNINIIDIVTLYDKIITYPFNDIFNKPAAKIAAKRGKAKPSTFEGKTVEIIKKVFKKGGKYKVKKRFYSKKQKIKQRKTRKNINYSSKQ